MDEHEKSVTEWIDQARIGDESARFQLWTRYFEQLLRIAKSRIGAKLRRFQDEEDVVCTAFNSLFELIQKDGFKENADRDDFWRLLVRITENKIKDLAKHVNSKKRGEGAIRGHSVFTDENSTHDGFGGIPDPSPEFAEQFGLALAEMWDQLNPMMTEILKLKMLGYSNLEIAKTLDVSEETVRRKIVFIRQQWEA